MGLNVTVVNLADFRRHSGRNTSQALGPDLADIMDALHLGGGALHRSVVVRQVAAWRGARTREEIAALDIELNLAFEEYIRFARRRRKLVLLQKPLGADSYRWAITDVGRQLLEDQASRRVQRVGR